MTSTNIPSADASEQSEPEDPRVTAWRTAVEAAAEAEAARVTFAEVWADVQERFADGDTSVTYQVKAKAQHDAEQSTVAAQRRVYDVARAYRAMPFEQTLAKVVAPMLSEALSVEGQTVPAVVVDEVPSEYSTLPALFIQQTKRHEHDSHDGHLSGELRLAYMRSPLHRPFNAKEVWDALDDRHTRMREPHSTEGSGGPVVVDRCTLNITCAWEDVPSISTASPAPYQLHNVKLWLRSAVVEEGGRGAYKGVQMGGEGWAGYQHAMDAQCEEVTKTSDTVTGGVRTIVVQAPLVVKPQVQGTPTSRGDLAVMRGTDAVNRLKGETWPGLGRLQKAEVVKTNPFDRGVRELIVRLTFVSTPVEPVTPE